jgi:hypothetical protein
MYISGGDAENRDIYSSGITQANCIIQTPDDGFVLAGNTNAYGAGRSDAWLVKIDSSGNMAWNHTYGGSGMSTVSTLLGSLMLGSNGNLTDEVNSLIQTSDGGFAFAGITPTMPFEGYGAFAWLVKLDSSGNAQWNQTYPDIAFKDAYKYGYVNYPHADWTANSLIETSDGGFALAGAFVETGSISYYYLVKTQQALPPPSPTPIPTPNPASPSPQTVLPSDLNPIWNVLIASGIVFLVFSGIILLRKRKRQFSTTSS